MSKAGSSKESEIKKSSTTSPRWKTSSVEFTKEETVTTVKKESRRVSMKLVDTPLIMPEDQIAPVPQMAPVSQIIPNASLASTAGTSLKYSKISKDTSEEKKSSKVHVGPSTSFGATNSSLLKTSSLAISTSSAVYKTPSSGALSPSRSFYRYRKRLEGDAAKVLDPDNPLLEKFQNVLKEQLLRQIESLNDDIYENETGAKKKNIEREELGVEAYEYQQIISGQQTTLEKWSKDLTTMSSAKEEIEKQLQEKLDCNKKKRDELYDSERQEIQLRTEIEGTHLLLKQMSDWETDVESNISIRKTISEKTRKDKLRLAEQKRHQDGIIYKLMCEIWRLEGELEHMDMQLRVKETEREELAQSVALSNTNIEALNSEHRCLMHSWNSVLVAVQTKDKTINCLKEELGKINAKVKYTISEIEQVKKLAQKEMLENESLTMIKNRIDIDLKNCKTQIADETAKKEKVEQKIFEYQSIIEQTEKDILKTQGEYAGYNSSLKVLLAELDKHNYRKFELEQKLLKCLEHRLTENKSLMQIYKSLTKLKDSNRIYETSLADCENKHSNVLLECEMEKSEINRIVSCLKELLERQAELEKTANKYADESTKLDFNISKKQRVIDHLNNKACKMDALDADQTKSPLEAKINGLEKNISEMQEKIRDMQKFWLREQRNLVELSKQRQGQIHDINMLRKQILILEQKNLKMNDEVDTHKKIEEKMLHNVHAMQSKLTMLCDALCKKKGMKTLLDKGNEVIEQEYASRLKDTELECLKIQADSAEIEDDKLNLSKELVELNREALEWEKKLILVKETKQNMVDEQNESGEMFSMKCEIHRMQIRLTHLRKAQDKLIVDLEHCVARRDAIFSVAVARGKREKAGSDNTRVIFRRKLDHLKNKIKKAESEINRMKGHINYIEKKIAQTEHKIETGKSDIESTLEKKKVLVLENDEAETNKRMNVEVLVMKQRRLNMYLEISKNRTPYTIYRTENSLTSEYTKQKDLNTKLCLVMANLIADFPDHQTELSRMLNSLKVPAFIMYS